MDVFIIGEYGVYFQVREKKGAIVHSLLSRRVF
jgi:hypothetical protein